MCNPTGLPCLTIFVLRRHIRKRTVTLVPEERMKGGLFSPTIFLDRATMLDDHQTGSRITDHENASCCVDGVFYEGIE